MPDATNYPDVLGYITGGERADFGVLQAAAAIQPNPARAGAPIDVTVVLQNSTDAALEVLVVLQVPDKDLAGKKATFVAKVQRLAIGMQPSEVGVLTLPLLTQPATAPGLYRLHLQVTAKATGRANRIRLAEGGGAFYMGGMPRKAQQAIEALRSLRYSGSAARRGGLFAGPATLETVLKLETGGLGKILDRKADYQPLWQRRDLKVDPLELLERHREAMVQYVLPALDRTRLLEPLTNRTMTLFKDSWYELTEIEASLIARVMVRILEYACTGQLSYGRKFTPRPEYEVMPTLSKPSSARTAIKLRWLDSLLNLLEEDARAARFVSRFIPERCYDALLRDALSFALREVQTATGMTLGDDEELEKYADDWIARLEGGDMMTFSDVYLPLVLAGAILYDEVLLPDENVKSLLSQLQQLLQERAEERTDENAALFDLTRDVLDKSLRKYGMQML
jgi:hypothetical protein